MAEVGSVDHAGGVDLRRPARPLAHEGHGPQGPLTTTVREHRRTIEKTIKPVLGDVVLRKLDGATLDAF